MEATRKPTNELFWRNYIHAISDARMMINICHTGKKMASHARNRPTQTFEVSLSTEITRPVQPLCIFHFIPAFSLNGVY